MSSWLTHLIAFIVGAFTGAAGQYLADKFSDRRREKEARSDMRAAFATLTAKMPELIREMRTDLDGDATDTIREFFVLPSRNVLLGGSTKRRFVYYEAGHVGLREKLDLLEQSGFLIDVTTGNAPIFRMSEDFVQLVRNHGSVA